MPAGSFRKPRNASLEVIAALFEIVIHIPARTGRRKQHRIARLCHGKSLFDTRLHMRRKGKVRKPLLLCRFCDQLAVSAEQEHVLDTTREVCDQFVEFLPLAVAASDQNDIFLNGFQGDDCCIYVGSLGIVIELDRKSVV